MQAKMSGFSYCLNGAILYALPHLLKTHIFLGVLCRHTWSFHVLSGIKWTYFIYGIYLVDCELYYSLFFLSNNISGYV